MTTDPLDEPCPHCALPVGDHTIRGWTQCLEATGLNYTLPYEEVPGAPLKFDQAGDDTMLVGEVTVGAAALDGTALGKIPAVTFTFYAPGATPMSKVPTPTFVLVGDERMLTDLKGLVSANVDAALKAVRQ